MTRTDQKYDVIVVGSGAAGCIAALSLAPLKVALVTAGRMGSDCSSLWTQGGLAAAVGAGDNASKHAVDTMMAGVDIVDADIACGYTQKAADTAKYLEINGVQFDRGEGGYVLSREGGHSENRVLKAQSGDGFGRALMPVVWDKIKTAAHVQVIDQAKVVELLKSADGSVCGIVYETAKKVNTSVLQARAVIMAMGGAAALYECTTNPLQNTGAAISLAAKAGANLADLEFVQFHPTALDTMHGGTNPLLTEALRGYGAVLVNDAGERFMTDVHPLAELAPRDIVARAIAGQKKDGKTVYLDCRHINTDHFETLQKTTRTAGYDPAQDLLPVTPAAHYHMGGVATDIKGRTSVKGLWVIGEAASTGFHGANRLASNSILEAVSMGRLAAQDIKADWVDLGRHVSAVLPHVRQKCTAYLNPVLKRKIIQAMRRAMTENVGITRCEADLFDAQCFFEDVMMEYQGLDTDVEDMALVCRLITRSARMRTESRGGHYRSDFPSTDKAWEHRSFVDNDAGMPQTIKEIAQ